MDFKKRFSLNEEDTSINSTMKSIRMSQVEKNFSSKLDTIEMDISTSDFTHAMSELKEILEDESLERLYEVSPRFYLLLSLAEEKVSSAYHSVKQSDALSKNNNFKKMLFLLEKDEQADLGGFHEFVSNMRESYELNQAVIESKKKSEALKAKEEALKKERLLEENVIKETSLYNSAVEKKIEALKEKERLEKELALQEDALAKAISEDNAKKAITLKEKEKALALQEEINKKETAILDAKNKEKDIKAKALKASEDALSFVNKEILLTKEKQRKEVEQKDELKKLLILEKEKEEKAKEVEAQKLKTAEQLRKKLLAEKEEAKVVSERLEVEKRKLDDSLAIKEVEQEMIRKAQEAENNKKKAEYDRLAQAAKAKEEKNKQNKNILKWK